MEEGRGIYLTSDDNKRPVGTTTATIRITIKAGITTLALLQIVILGETCTMQDFIRIVILIWNLVLPSLTKTRVTGINGPPTADIKTLSRPSQDSCNILFLKDFFFEMFVSLPIIFLPPIFRISTHLSLFTSTFHFDIYRFSIGASIRSDIPLIVFFQSHLLYQHHPSRTSIALFYVCFSFLCRLHGSTKSLIYHSLPSRSLHTYTHSQ